MDLDSLTPTPWETLRPWPAWRGLEESLLELAQMLRRIDAATGTGSGALEIAEEITALLQDPESQLPSGDWHRRFAPGRPGGRDEPPEVDELPGLLRELACWVADAPILLESPDASRQLGQTLIQELPRWWQGRFSSLLFGLRQMLQSAAFRKAGAGAGAGPAAAEPRREAPAPAAQPDPFPPRLVFTRGGDYFVTLPGDAPPALNEAAQWEVLYAILRDFGPEAARLHLLLLGSAGGQPISHAEVHQALGLRRSLTRREKDELCHGLLRQLSGLRVNTLRYQSEGAGLACSRSSRPLWELKLQHFGQAQLEERRGTVVARGQDWSVQVAESALPVSGVLPEVDPAPAGARQRLHLTLAILPARVGADGGPVALPNAALLRLAGLPLRPESRREQAKLWQELKQVARAQGAHGWLPDLTGWPLEVGRHLTRPDAVDPSSPDDWERFLQANTTFAIPTEEAPSP